MDFAKDNNPGILKHVEEMLGGFPEFVKGAYDKGELAYLDNLHPSNFADPVNREYPLDTNSNILLSYSYAKVAGVPQVILGRIKAASDNARLGVEQLDAMFDAHVKVSSDMDHAMQQFALIVKDASVEGGHHFLYPASDFEDVVSSALELANDRAMLPQQAFKEAATNLMDAALDYGVPGNYIPDVVQHAGSRRKFDKSAVQLLVEQRKDVVDEGSVDLYEKIAASVEHNPGEVDEFVKLCEQLDRMNCVTYSDRQIDPVTAFYSGMTPDEVTKAANQFVMVAEAPVPIEEFISRADVTYFTGPAYTGFTDAVKAARAGNGIEASIFIQGVPEESQTRMLGIMLGNDLLKYATQMANQAVGAQMASGLAASRQSPATPMNTVAQSNTPKGSGSVNDMATMPGMPAQMTLGQPLATSMGKGLANLSPSTASGL
jgi:hypothetical protein